MTDKRNFSNLPFEKRIKLTKESIEKELKESNYYTPKNVTINTKYFLEIIEQAERVEELEKKVQRYEQKFEEILELGWTENFGGSYVNMGEYHADAIQIAESALGRSKRND